MITAIDQVNLQGKVCLVTGATNGIGLVTARTFAHMGAEVFLTCRNPIKGEGVIKQIAEQTGNEKLTLLTGDFASLEQIHKIARTFLDYKKPLHLLVNNAGVFNTDRQVTVDGHEEMFAVNHLAPFLLTNLLIDRIKSSAPARIVNVASGAHMLVKGINFEDLNFERDFSFLKVYSHSKLSNILFTRELAKRLHGTLVTANAADPGEVSTGLGVQNGWFARILYHLMKPFMKTSEQGAQTSIHVGSAPNLEGISGKYFRDCQEKEPKPWARDEDMAKRLWEISSQLVGLK